MSLINGSNGQPYERHELNQFGNIEWRPQSFLVIGDPLVAESLPEGILFLPWVSAGSDHDIQNGNPDGVRLTDGEETLDSMSYGGVIETLTEGEIGAPDDRDGMDNLTISRCPHDLDTDNNASDFRLATATPGVGNECDEP